MKKISLSLLVLTLAACVNTPKQLRGEFSEVDPITYSENPIPNTPVRWGGTIIKTTPGKEETCIEVLGKRTDRSGRPLLRDKYTTGRFMACKPGFYDPAIYKPDRRITVKGWANGVVEGTVGEHTYLYPKVDAETFYLWYDFDYIDRYYRYPPYYGGWIWYYPYSGFYYSGPGVFWGWYDPFPLRHYYPHGRHDEPHRSPRLRHANTRPHAPAQRHGTAPRSRNHGGTGPIHRKK